MKVRDIILGILFLISIKEDTKLSPKKRLSSLGKPKNCKQRPRLKEKPIVVWNARSFATNASKFAQIEPMSQSESNRQISKTKIKFCI